MKRLNLKTLNSIPEAMLSKKTITKGAAALSMAFAALPAMAQEAAETAEKSALLSGETKFWLLVGMLVFQVILLFTVRSIIKSFTGSKGMWKKILESKKAAAMLTALFVVAAGTVTAQSGVEPMKVPFMESESIQNLLITLNGVLLLAIIILLYTLKKLVRILTAETAEEAQPETAWGGLMSKLTDAVPVENEEDILTDHDYDGIQELDNNLPPWWVLGFYITIACAVVYIGYYEFYKGGNISKQEYAAEMKAAAEAREAYLAELGSQIDENNVTLLSDASALASGEKIFKTNCKPCHGENAQGINGPNLTDEYWLHGGGIKNVFTTIKYGVPLKGMIAWEDQLAPPQMQEVASYIMSLQGSNPAEAKAPEGEKWVPEEEDASADEETTTESDSTAVAAEETNNDDQVAEL
tara:strand:+ start:2083 stop:3315 length:1233 start_codon:yes stop_codon:yes gene_type:complete